MEYIKLKVDPIQLKVIRDISNGLCELMNVPLLAMRGIIWRALNQWQIKNKKTISEIMDLPLNENLIAAKEIFDIAKGKLKAIITEPVDQNEQLLDIIFEKAFRYYMNYVNRIRR
ncbi:MAG: hypothetical protein ACFE8E_00175 [Candidatus Hodarchaeota archaeon]